MYRDAGEIFFLHIDLLLMLVTYRDSLYRLLFYVLKVLNRDWEANNNMISLHAFGCNKSFYKNYRSTTGICALL